MHLRHQGSTTIRVRHSQRTSNVVPIQMAQSLGYLECLVKNGSNAMSGSDIDGSDVDFILAKHILRVADMSYQTQLDNYQSLLGHAGRLISGVALLSIATVTTMIPAASIFEGARWKGAYVILCALMLGTMIAGFILALIAQLRFGFQALNSPKELKDALVDIQNSERSFKTNIETAQHFCDSIEVVYSSIHKRNKTMSALLHAASIVLIISVGFVALFAIATAILYLR